MTTRTAKQDIIEESDDAVGVDKVKPIGTFVFVRKCKRADEGLIITTTQYKEYCEFVEILRVGSKCRIFDADCVGKFCHSPEGGDGMHCVDGEGEYWMIREDLLEPMVIEK